MSDPSPRRRASRTGNPEVDKELEALLDTLGVSANRDQLLDIFTTAVHLATDKTDRLDLKIASSALREMRAGFQVFAPHRHVPKVTMFGSARTLQTDPLYRQARDLAAVLAAHGWSTVTGAGPGIMAAGLEGAGPDHAFGINIELPFETEPNEFIASDPKLVSMKYFFTRKLLLIKESDGFAVLPGGFGTLDEEFELLTLLQTGKAAPAPIVLLEVPGGTYWHAWEDWLITEVEPRKLINPDDRYFYKITDSVAEAAAELFGFYRNYHSLRFVGHTLVHAAEGPAHRRRAGRPVGGVRRHRIGRRHRGVARAPATRVPDRGPSRPATDRLALRPNVLRPPPVAHRRPQPAPERPSHARHRRHRLAWATEVYSARRAGFDISPVRVPVRTPSSMSPRTSCLARRESGTPISTDALTPLRTAFRKRRVSGVPAI